MQRSSRSRPFKSGHCFSRSGRFLWASDSQGLGSQIGASPITDAIWLNASCPRSSVRSERHRAKVEVAGASPAVDAILPLCLSKPQDEFCKPEAPAYGDHDV